jgi:hypothetical protein
MEKHVSGVRIYKKGAPQYFGHFNHKGWINTASTF